MEGLRGRHTPPPSLAPGDAFLKPFPRWARIAPIVAHLRAAGHAPPGEAPCWGGAVPGAPAGGGGPAGDTSPLMGCSFRVWVWRGIKKGIKRRKKGRKKGRKKKQKKVKKEKEKEAKAKEKEKEKEKNKEKKKKTRQKEHRTRERKKITGA